MNSGFKDIMDIRGRGMPEDGEVAIKGNDPVFSARFKIGETTANILAGVGVAVTDIHEMKTGRRQKIAIDVRYAVATCQSSKLMTKLDPEGGWKVVQSPFMEHMRSITQPWRTKDGRWYLPHFNLPHLHDRVIGVLKCESNADAVAKAVAKWDSHDLEEAVAAARACGSIVRSNSEWLQHPHGKMLAGKPLVEITKIGDSEPIPFPKGGRPLSGIRVLDLTRILAGPIAARTLAEHGAYVLMVTAEHLPQVPEHIMDTNHGKRSCFLDLNKAEDVATIKKLVRNADVFSQATAPASWTSTGSLPSSSPKSGPGSSTYPSAPTATAARSRTAADGSRSPSARPGSASTTATSGRSCCRPPRATTRPATTAPTACCSRSRGVRAKAAPTTSGFRYAGQACTSTSRAT
jgi:hypothetical protein